MEKGWCEEVSIPIEEQEFKTKPKFALDIIIHQLDKRVSFNYVGVDGLYENDIIFDREIDNRSQIYMLDINST